MSPAVLSFPVLLVAGLVAGGAYLAAATPPRLPSSAAAATTVAPDLAPAPEAAEGLLRRARPLWSLLAGAGAAVFLAGPLAGPAGLTAATFVWVLAGEIEPAAVRRRRIEVRRDLPHVVTLLAAALHAGLAPAAAIEHVSRALPGAASYRLAPVAARLQLGGDPVAIWTGLAADPDLAPLGRTLARAHRTGAPIVAAVERLATDLAAHARAEVEARARAVGVRAAVPLGLCLLPSFLLLGVVPLAVALAATVV
ncbi:type II secretion system F family protein [Nocardioides ginsengisoli]|uniref:Type II secretion system F family protein n=1 Tax=Nocardioides ginsengisoli TaxID=363868 RepID=A0ABW3VT96_9ACTN